MLKRNDIEGYIFVHKLLDYGVWDNSLYTPLEVGAALREPIYEIRDNTGGNISDWNSLYAETTGTYWVWKHHSRDTKYILQCQYRRRLLFDESTDFDKWFKECDVIVAAPLFLVSSTVRQQYESCHSRKDMEQVGKIIKNYYPEYSESFNRWINNGKFIFYSNGFVMRAEDYDRYCEFLFNICEQLRIMNGWFTPKMAKEKIEKEIASGERANINGHIGGGTNGTRYQSQVLGFLSERLFTLWVLHNFKPSRIKCIDYKIFEEGL